MARKRFNAEISAPDVADKIKYQIVQFIVNGETVDTKTIGPEGGNLLSSGFELADNQTNVLKMIVTPVDQADVSATAPFIVTETLDGADTIPPGTPPPSTFTVEDDAPQATPAA